LAEREFKTPAGTTQELLPMNLATHAGLIAGTSVLTIASAGTAGDLDSVIDGIINDSATISGDDAFSIGGLGTYAAFYDTGAASGDQEYAQGIGEVRLDFSGDLGDGWSWKMAYNVNGDVYQVFQSDGAFDVDNSISAFGLKKEFDNGLMVGFGRGRAIFGREAYVNTADQLGLAPSFSALATGITTESITVGYEADQFRGVVQLHDQLVIGSDTAGLTDGDGDAAMPMTGRVEFMAMGNNWDAMSSLSSTSGSEQSLVFGLGYSDDDVFDGMTYDVSWYMDAACVSVAFYDFGDSTNGEVETMTINASYWVNDNGQAYFRYEDLEADAGTIDSIALDGDNWSIGWNQYYGDNFRINAEVNFDGGTNGDTAVAGMAQFTF